MIKLSTRLKRIADFINDDSNIVDIGCDHGLLDIYLSKNKKNINIIASDVRQSALNNAISNIKKYKEEENIKTILSNGLDNIDTTNIDTIIISGMGTHTIVGILYNNLKKLKNIKTLVIQSNNDDYFLRYKLTKIGFKIEEETLVEDAKIIYTIIKFTKGYKIYSKKELYLGPMLLKENSNLFKKKNKLELKNLEIIYEKIPNKHFSYKRKVKNKIKMLKNLIK